MAGHKPIGYVEFDKFARRSYEAMYKTEGEWTAHDITTVTDDDIRQLGNRGRIDVITGGFPCQAFSIAGKRKGFEDTRGTLFFEIARFANILSPRYLFLENVKGLLNHDNGNTFETIIRTLDELGYDAEWDLLNSKDFGVPQNRERVFIIGHLRGTSTRKVFPVRGNDSKINRTEINKVGNIRKKGKSQSGDVVSSSGLAPTLCSTQTQKDPTKIIVAGELDIKANDQNKRVYSKEGISPSLTTMQGGGQEPKIIDDTNTGFNGIKVSDISPTLRSGRYGLKVAQPVLTPGRENKRQNGRRFKENGEPSFTLTSQDRHGIYDGYRIRKLTPKECFRLQGFPDELFDKAAEVNSDSQLYKQAGNSVTVNVIYEIAKKLGVDYE